MTIAQYKEGLKLLEDLAIAENQDSPKSITYPSPERLKLIEYTSKLRNIYSVRKRKVYNNFIDYVKDGGFFVSFNDYDDMWTSTLYFVIRSTLRENKDHLDKPLGFFNN